MIQIFPYRGISLVEPECPAPRPLRLHLACHKGNTSGDKQESEQLGAQTSGVANKGNNNASQTGTNISTAPQVTGSGKIDSSTKLTASGGGNVFGKANLASPDTVALGQKYRVTLQVYSAYTPINLASFSANWGATIGTYDLAIKQEIIPKDTTSDLARNFLMPWSNSISSSGGICYWTNTFNLLALKWEGDAGYVTPPRSTSGMVGATYFWGALGSYTNGSHTRVKQVTLSDTIAITNATGITVDAYSSGGNYPALTLKPNAGTITKPAGYAAKLTFPIVWRAIYFPNIFKMMKMRSAPPRPPPKSQYRNAQPAAAKKGAKARVIISNSYL